MNHSRALIIFLLAGMSASSAAYAFPNISDKQLLSAGCGELSQLQADESRIKKLVSSYNFRVLAGDDLRGYALCAHVAEAPKLAIEALNQLIQDDPQPYFAHHYRALAHIDLGQTAAAIRDLQTSIAKELGGEDDYRLLSEIYLSKGDNLAAVKLLESERKLVESRQPGGERPKGVGSFSPREERLALELSSAYKKLNNVAAACSTLEWGFKRNNLSQKIFDTFISCLQTRSETQKSGCIARKAVQTPSFRSRSTVAQP